MNQKNNKKILRKKILQLRNALTKQEIYEKSIEIKNIFYNLNIFKNSDTILFYVSFGSEVRTDFIIKELIGKKRIIVPKVNREKKFLILSELKDFDKELNFGYAKILEPKQEYIRLCKIEDIDIIITPGVVFSEGKYRIGYGGGYYDKLIKEYRNKRRNGVCIGFAYELQIKNFRPDIYDEKVDFIITEKRIIPIEKFGY